MATRRRLIAAVGSGSLIGSLYSYISSNPNEGLPTDNKSSDYTRKIHQNTIEVTYTFFEKLGGDSTNQIKSKIEIPKSLYNKHTRNSDIYHEKILNSSSDSFVRNEISESFIPDYNNKEVWNIMRFVQEIKYSRDWNTTDATDYTRHPVETIVDMVGDCKDKTNLLYSILKNRGYSMGYVIFPQHIAPIISKKEISASTDDIDIMHKNEKHEYVVLESTHICDIGYTEYEKNNIIYAYTDYDGFTIRNPDAIEEQINKMFGN